MSFLEAVEEVVLLPPPMVTHFQASVHALNITASATATGGVPPYTYVWSFGDGSTAEGQTVQHTFASPGTYPVSVSVTDSVGGETTDSTKVTVSPLIPSVTVARPVTFLEALLVLIRDRVEEIRSRVFGPPPQSQTEGPGKSTR